MCFLHTKSIFHINNWYSKNRQLNFKCVARITMQAHYRKGKMKGGMEGPRKEKERENKER